MIPPEQRAEIRRLYYAEHWRVGTIATQLGVHHETVRAAINRASVLTRGGHCRATTLDPYLAFVRDTLAQYPRLRATRLHEMLRVRGYPGSAVQLRRAVRHLRPAPAAAAFLRLPTLPGESAQVDWGSFGRIRIGRGERPLSGFVLVLSYSRAIHAVFTLDQTLESFLRGHVEAIHALGGCARTLVYDNLKSAVLDRQGSAIHFHPRLLELAGHYHFAPRPCAPARAHEKGKVERQIQYLRHAFFAARPFRDLDDLHAQFAQWRDTVAHQRRHPERRDQTVAAVFADEQRVLLPLPTHPFETTLVRPTRSGKQPYLTFDRNQYSLPHTLVRRPVTLLADATTVRVLDGTTEVARHARSYDTGAVIEDPTHLAALVEAKAAARPITARARLRQAVPALDTLFTQWAAHGDGGVGQLRRLLDLLDDYGATALAAAVDEALTRPPASAATIAYLLEQQRRRRGLAPVVPLVLPNHPGVQDLEVPAHALESYDALSPDRPRDPE
ncbi:MAG: IS21 family transposase [Acidobacteria bacterium]|nr:IS21 family transposase [Acidobacteriota bacterium]